MIETLIATVILSVGLLSLAGLMSKMDLTSHNSRYVNVAAVLCSEKLEELTGGMVAQDVNIQIPSGTSVGSLTSDQKLDIGGITVAYFDEVTMGAASGSISETQLDADGDYYNIKQTPKGGTPETQKDKNPPDQAVLGKDAVTFKRRWIIEKDIPGLPSQVRRITVRVEYPSAASKPGQYQMSAVRNGQP